MQQNERKHQLISKNYKFASSVVLKTRRTKHNCILPQLLVFVAFTKLSESVTKLKLC